MKDTQLKGGSQDCPTCWGEYAQGTEKCGACAYAEACRWCAGHPDRDAGRQVKREKHLVSFDRLAYSEELAVADEPPQDALEIKAVKADDGGECRRDDLLAILAFLARLDDYTLEILSIVLGGDATTASGIAREMDISRQAVHRKLCWAVEHYPELRSVLNVYLRRCERIIDARKARAEVKKRGARPAKHQTSADDRRPDNGWQQLEFF